MTSLTLKCNKYLKRQNYILKYQILLGYITTLILTNLMNFKQLLESWLSKLKWIKLKNS